MKRVLIATIIRDSLPHLDAWWAQLTELTRLLQGAYSVSLSVAENDSVDGSGDWLHLRRDQVQDTLESFYLSTDTLGTQRYGSVWNEQRLKQLAAARQRCLDQVGDALQGFDKVAFVEPDVTYDPRWCRELILARHPLAAGLGEPDIYSGWSLRTLANPKESNFLFDTCATRATKDDVCWDVTEQCGRWRGATVIPTDLGGPDSMCLHPVWSTFNGFCVYNTEPFKRGVRWGYVNTRLNNGQQWIDTGVYPHTGVFNQQIALQLGVGGYLEADTVCVCESFRAAGYDKVYLNTNCLIRHG